MKNLIVVLCMLLCFAFFQQPAYADEMVCNSANQIEKVVNNYLNHQAEKFSVTVGTKYVAVNNVKHLISVVLSSAFNSEFVKSVTYTNKELTEKTYCVTVAIVYRYDKSDTQRRQIKLRQKLATVSKQLGLKTKSKKKQVKAITKYLSQYEIKESIKFGNTAIQIKKASPIGINRVFNLLYEVYNKNLTKTNYYLICGKRKVGRHSWKTHFWNYVTIGKNDLRYLDAYEYIFEKKDSYLKKTPLANHEISFKIPSV